MRRALVAGRHQPLSEGVRGLLEPMFEVIVMVADEASLFDALERMEAEVAVVDLSIGASDGFGLLRRIRHRAPHLALIAIGEPRAPSVARTSLATGATAFVARTRLASDLAPAIEAALAGPNPKKEML